MRFDIVTLFPELFGPFFTEGVTRRAFGSGQVDVRLWPLRDFALDAYKRVDDRAYGGGPGMVLLAEPLERALQAIRADRADRADRAEPSSRGPVVLLSPTGRRIDQGVVREFAAGPGAVLICGRYEGVDQRFVDAHVDMELSLGDFVLSGGELPALALLDAVARLQEGVLNDARSHAQDSFEDGLLDHPHFSRPEQWLRADGLASDVPEVLMSGHHGRIAQWRREQSLTLTARRRPDLIISARAAGRLSAADEAFLIKLAVY